MQVQVRHDENLPGDRNDWIAGTVEAALERFGAQITTVEVHFADEDGPKNAEGAIRCTIEVRPAGFPPFAVTSHSSDMPSALDGALEKIERKLDSQLGRVRDHHANL
jgi:ribosome-associated translation inhibitor RaiA